MSREFIFGQLVFCFALLVWFALHLVSSSSSVSEFSLKIIYLNEKPLDNDVSRGSRVSIQ